MAGICDTQAITDIMAEKKISVGEMCKALNIDKSTFYRKMQNHGKGFTVEEIQIICIVLGLSDKQKLAIFFTNGVA